MPLVLLMLVSAGAAGYVVFRAMKARRGPSPAGKHSVKPSRRSPGRTFPAQGTPSIRQERTDKESGQAPMVEEDLWSSGLGPGALPVVPGTGLLSSLLTVPPPPPTPPPPPPEATADDFDLLASILELPPAPPRQK